MHLKTNRLSQGLPEHLLFSPNSCSSYRNIILAKRNAAHLPRLPVAFMSSSSLVTWSLASGKVTTTIVRPAWRAGCTVMKIPPSPTCLCFWNQPSQLNCNHCCLLTCLFIIYLLNLVLFFLWTNFAYQMLYWNPARLDLFFFPLPLTPLPPPPPQKK